MLKAIDLIAAQIMADKSNEVIELRGTYFKGLTCRA